MGVAAHSMIAAFVEPSGESAALARAELEGALTALGGELGTIARAGPPGLTPVRVPERASLSSLAQRLALARRVLVRLEGDAVAAARRAGASGESASFRRVGAAGSTADAEIRRLGGTYVEGGGSIDLERPKARYWLSEAAGSEAVLLREIAEVDRAQYTARAMPRLPFRRPVALPPRLARAATNLSAIRPGERLLDPFLGTGALLSEAALLGARVYGIDADPAMVRGALKNLHHLGVTAEAVVEGDARTVEFPEDPGPFDALVTDPPYGRSSASVGSEPSELVPRVIGRWAERLRPGGRIVVLSPGGPPTLPAPYVEGAKVAVRVHRSLTREFRWYRRAA